MASRAEEKEEARAARLAAEEAERRSARRRASIMRLGLVLGLAVVAVVVAIVLSSSGNGNSGGGGGGGATPGDAAAVKALFRGIPEKGIDLGGASNVPTLVEFVDLQCPFCARFDRDVLPTVINRYVRPGRVRIELRTLAFLGPDSVRAANAVAAAAAQDRLWPFVDRFYAAQGVENSGYVTDGFIRDVARGIPGLDPAPLLRAGAGTAAVSQARAQAMAAGIVSTPSFLVGPTGGALRRVQLDSLDPGAFGKVLDAALARP
jgi:protein-disulfide isomerase